MMTPDQTPAELAAETADEQLNTARRTAAGVDDTEREFAALVDAAVAQADQTRALRLAVVEAGLRIARAVERSGR